MTQLPNWGTSFNKLTYLGVHNNQLTSIPNFKNHVNKANLEILVQNNKLDFATIEQNFTAAGAHPFKIFTYSPQPNPLTVPENISVQLNAPLTIDAPSGGLHGVYLWEKFVNGSWVNVNNQSQSILGNKFVRNNIALSDEGTYRYKVTNTWVPNLSFESGPIEVMVDDAHISSVAAKYNGLITSARWRTDAVYGSETPEFTGMYLYDYDDKDQVRNAGWANPNFGLKSFSDAGNKFRIADMDYDPNGNILKLKRYNENGIRIHNFSYDYDDISAGFNNKLQSIDGYVNAYTYNKIGQLIGEDKTEGDDQYIDYDVTGKVIKVYNNISKQPSSLKLQNVYDDRGFRLAKINYETQRTTWYIRDASGSVTSIYEQQGVEAAVTGQQAAEPMTQTEIPVYGAGKLGTYYPVQDASMSYEITDHLGNVRALLREDVMVFTATMEDNNQEAMSNPRVQEMAYFKNLFETAVDDANVNHTSNTVTVVANPSRSAYLFWQDGVAGIEAADKSIGPSIALEVDAGDVFNAETFVVYENKESYSRDITLAALSSLLGNNFVSSIGFDGSTIQQATAVFNDALSLGTFFGDGNDESIPFAYLNYVVFNASKVAIASDRVRVSEDASFDAPTLHPDHEQLRFADPIVIGPGGKYIYVWVSNESENTKVWFDDIKITRSSNFVSQASDYGVWGDVLREERSNVLDKYRFGYQGQFAEKDEETGWNHFDLREYDPLIGRWTSNDPYGQFWSPYVGMGNSGINSIDYDGGYSFAGALWRNVFYGGSGIFQSGEDGGKPVWGFNTSAGAHFGEDSKSFLKAIYSDGSDDIMNRASQASFNMISFKLSIPDRIMATRGGDGIVFDPLTQLTLGMVAINVGVATGSSILSVSTAPGKSLFWSGMSEAAVNEFAASSGLTPLNMTQTGRFLNATQGAVLPFLRKSFWKAASARYAAGASGDAFVLSGYSVETGGVWMQVERQILMNNSRVSGVHFIVP